ncbi:pre-rRNA processing protein Tsr1, putative [Cordyceps militaris CM01]|uniref:Pre-rRNA processing protein Tsr1, putative n=1 Tax=Cordyceps militaris (strain CM01) TaxID=983644 RepID=G3J724_CORMM|nr:pre-rRNA processing protein Tsr1, putative [Cordyceps militaris CM01]EGX97097.1 pre-rRNA processing protein Tsr1, putative [Cordyceps militaris CM01]
MPTAVAHSHRPTTKVSHKPFKSKAASKHELRDRAKGRVPDEKGSRKTPHQQVMSKFDRRNQAKQARLIKHKEHLKGSSVFNNREGAPRIVAVLPLCPDGDAAAAIQQLNGSLDITASVQPGNFRVSVDRFKQKLQYMPLQRDLTECLDATRVADFVVVILSASIEVDQLGELILRSVESQGLSTLITVVQGLEKIEPAKQRPGVVSSLKSFITHFHPEQEKIFNLENRQECANLMRSLCSTTPKGVRWRDERSWLLAEDIQFANTETDTTVITGVVRGRGLKADRLVQVGDWGTFQIEKIVAAPLAKHGKGNATQSAEDEASQVLDEPSDDCDDLNELAPEDVLMDTEEAEEDPATAPKKGVLLDDHHYFSEGEEEKAEQAKRKVPKGTSKYQSAWYLEDVSDSESDMEDMEMEDTHAEEYQAAPEDGIEGYAQPEPTEGGPSEYPQSEMMEELDEAADAEQLAQYRSKKHDEAEDDKEFPDEIELHPQVLARERLARYRGLKSLRTSAWQEDEDRAHEPEDWRRLLRIPDYAASKGRAVREALVGGVEPGTRVHVFLKGLSPSLAQSHKPTAAVALFSLFRHENKKTAVNYLFNLSTDYGKSVKSKEELIVQCGPRRMVINPLFSQAGTTPNNVHKYARYLHPGGSAIATFMGPVTWGAVPVLFFKRTTTEPGTDPLEGDGPGLALIGTGTALPPSTNRVVAKRILLTGHPYHINKKIVTIRYMFFNREDVEWFKAMPLWTRRGRSGFIKEPLGTHGYFKATFDGRINPQDSIGVSLYKRVWPRNATPVRGSLLEAGAAVSAVEADGDLTMA